MTAPASDLTEPRLVKDSEAAVSTDAPRIEPHAVDALQVVSSLQSDRHHGLTTSAAEAIRERHGWNELATTPPEPAWKRFAAQFADVVVWILLVAAVVSGLVGEWTDTAAITAIVLLNAIIGFSQEERAERSLAALQRLAAPLARVVRDGKLTSIPSRELVPGDIVEIEAGDHIPADVRLLTAFSMQIQEASLTGESTAVEKDSDIVLPAETSVADRQNMAFLSTVVTAGQGTGVVIATGMQTEIGRIAGMIESCKRELTPLQRRLAELGRLLITVCLILVALIFVLTLWRGHPVMDALLTSICLAVAAVPEGLPAVVTISLALGLQRMVQRNALIRKLPSVETLGCVTVICSDKTGTLTRNEMTVREVIAGGHRYQVTGSGYNPQGSFVSLDAPSQQSAVPNDDLLMLLHIAAYCNHAHLQPDREGSQWKVTGDATEGALLVMAMKGQVAAHERRPHIVDELPFDSDRKAMSVIVEREQGGRIQYTKGALEAILGRCSHEQTDSVVNELTEGRKQELIRADSEMASRALRVLGFAYRHDRGPEPRIDESGLIFVGMVGMIDPPREEVKEAVVRCREAGIRPVMITGDHPETANAIARELGIATQADRTVTGAELQSMSDEELTESVPTVAVYARVSPEHKLRIVRAWKGRGEIVAMTGDGVNDAPAVRAADIGIAMGITGTDVTRETSSMVLMDDNFASIVNAVEEGRAIYDNILKFLVFLLSCNAGEMLLMLLAALFGWPPPLLPVQLLWLNLVTDGLPALALALEPPEPGTMSRKPRPQRESVISWTTGASVMLQGVLLAAVGLVAFGMFQGEHPEDLDRARTMTFCVVVYGELFRALAARSRILTFWQLGPFTNPYVLGAVAISALLQVAIVHVPALQPVFATVAWSGAEWVILLLLALAPMLAIESAKLVAQAWNRTP